MVKAPLLDHRLVALILFLATSLVGASCASIRPVGKIGLLAPFEGLERRTGYDALAAMRTALDATAPTGIELLPAALDTSRDARRASQKLVAGGESRQDGQTLLAVIGPFTPQAAHAISDVISAASVPWVLPFAMTQTGFAPLTDARWAVELLTSLAEAARGQQAQRLVLAGWTPGWPGRESSIWGELSALPVIFLDNPTDIQNDDAVIWLGAADGAARFLGDLRRGGSSASFWLALGGDDPVFVERAQGVGPDSWGDVFYAKWTPMAYNGGQAQQPSMPTSNIAAFSATQTAIAQALGVATPVEKWAVQIYRLSDAVHRSPVIFGN